MKAFLMYPDRDFDIERELPANEPDLNSDLELDILLRAMAADWEARVDDYSLLVGDPGLAVAIERAGVTLIGYRPIRDLMRSQS